MSVRTALAAFAALTLLALDVTAAARGSGTPTPVLRVFAASSLSGAFEDIGRELERRRPGLEVRFHFAGSQQLAAQLEHGAAAAVFASADERWMERVRGLGLIDGEVRVFARNRLVVIVPRANPARIRGLPDLARAGIKLVVGAETVPVGRYGRVVLRNLSADSSFGRDFADRVLRNVVSEEENARAVVGKVQLGEADAGIVYRSDVSPALARHVTVIGIPERANVIAAYPIARLRGSAASDAARAFVDLVLSPDGQRRMAAAGFLPVTGPRP